MAVNVRKRVKTMSEKDLETPGVNKTDEDSGKKQTQPSGGMGPTTKSAFTIIQENKQETEKTGDKQGDVKEKVDNKPNTAEPSRPSADTGANDKGGKVVVEETQEEKRRRKLSERKIEIINKAANDILDCLDPRFVDEYKIAAKEYSCKDIGVYILAVLNRLAKEVDFYNPDFEPEWEQGIVGFTTKLYCRYCGKEIENPTKFKQVYCCNLCAKYDREQNEPGIIYPDQTIEGKSIEEQEKDAYLAEKKRRGEEG